MRTIPATGPVDDLGLLVHEDDAAAQLALAMAHLEAAVRVADHDLTDLAAIRVVTVDRAATDGVLDVLSERLADLGLAPAVDVIDIDRLPLPGMLLTLEADLAPPTSSGLDEEIPPQKEER